MRVLLVTSLFPPDIAANAKRMAHLAEDLQSRGHHVTVIAGFPHYPHGVVPRHYKRRMFVREQYNGANVVRTYVYASRNRTFVKRLMNFVSFTASSLIGAWRLKGNYDMVITISPPLLSGLSGYLISLFKNSRFVFDVQDIYPQTAVSLGVLKNKLIIWSAEHLERFIYRKASLVAVISEGFKKDILGKGVSEGKITVIPNWVDTTAFKAMDGTAARREHALEGQFVVMFMGTIGLAQGAEYIIEAARILAQYADIRFVFLGDGAEKNKIAALAQSHKLANVVFIPSQPNSTMPMYLSMADVCLVHLRKNELYTITIPSKTYEYMAAGKPIVMGVLGEAERLINDARCGLRVAPENPDEMSAAILHFYRNRDLAREWGQRGTEYVVKQYDRKYVMDKYLGAIENVSKRSSYQ